MDWTIVWHKYPDLDSLFSGWLLRKEGDAKYSGIGQAKFVFFDGNAIVAPGRIYVDCGERDYDHHPVHKFPGDCSATLIAKDLGLTDNEYYTKMLKYVKTSDLRGGDQSFFLASTIKLMNQLYPDNPEKVVDWAFEAFEAEFNAQLDLSFSGFEVEGFSKIEIPLPENLVGFIYAGTTENRSFSKWARYKGAAIVVQRENSGNVQIFTNPSVLGGRYITILEDIVSILRVEEIWNGRRKMPADDTLLRAEAAIENVPEWYLDHLTKTILNGSFTHPEVPPTKLSFEKVLDVVKMGMSIMLPNKDCRETVRCQGNKCRCYWYRLQKCRQLRYETLHKNKTSLPNPPLG